jgi:hypothetical protein
MFVWILYMFRVTMCSSSGGQLYEYNFWYNHSVLVAFRYAGQDRNIPSWPAYRTATIIEWLYQKLYSYNLFSCGWAHNRSKHVEVSGKQIIEEIVRQFVYLPELWVCVWTDLKIGSKILKVSPE